MFFNSALFIDISGNDQTVFIEEHVPRMRNVACNRGLCEKGRSHGNQNNSERRRWRGARA